MTPALGLRLSYLISTSSAELLLAPVRPYIPLRSKRDTLCPTEKRKQIYIPRNKPHRSPHSDFRFVECSTLTRIAERWGKEYGNDSPSGGRRLYLAQACLVNLSKLSMLISLFRAVYITPLQICACFDSNTISTRQLLQTCPRNPHHHCCHHPTVKSCRQSDWNQDLPEWGTSFWWWRWLRRYRGSTPIPNK